MSVELTVAGLQAVGVPGDVEQHLSGALQLGFEPLDPLRVWHRPAA